MQRIDRSFLHISFVVLLQINIYHAGCIIFRLIIRCNVDVHDLEVEKYSIRTLKKIMAKKFIYVLTFENLHFINAKYPLREFTNIKNTKSYLIVLAVLYSLKNVSQWIQS